MTDNAPRFLADHEAVLTFEAGETWKVKAGAVCAWSTFSRQLLPVGIYTAGETFAAVQTVAVELLPGEIGAELINIAGLSSGVFGQYAARHFAQCVAAASMSPASRVVYWLREWTARADPSSAKAGEQNLRLLCRLAGVTPAVAVREVAKLRKKLGLKFADGSAATMGAHHAIAAESRAVRYH